MKTTDTIYVYGKHVIREALAVKKRVAKIYLKHGLDKTVLHEFESIANRYKIPVQLVDERTLDKMSEFGVHQGVVAEVNPPECMELKEWLLSVSTHERPLLVILDGILDPHNVGAIIRSASAAGAHGIMIAKHAQAPINATVYKTSAGTLGKIPLVEVTNINDAILKLKESRFWIIGLSMKAKKTYWEEEYNAPIALVIGGEGSGMKMRTEGLCDLMVTIPMENSVESLNASVSAALVLYEWKRKNLS